MKVLVTGATGTIGRRVVAGIVGAGHQVRATSRSPQSTSFANDIEVADCNAATRDLVEDIGAILVVPTALGDTPVERLSQMLAVSEANVHVVLLSSASAADPESPTGARLLPLEQTVAEHGGTWSIWRSVPFALNTSHWWASTVRSGRFADMPYPDVATAFIDESDAADALTAALLRPPTYSAGTLTGPNSLTSRELVAEISAQLGQEVQVREISPDEVRRRLAVVGAPAWAVDGLLRSFEYAAQHGAATTNNVATLTGRPARSYREWVTEHLHDFDRSAVHPRR